MNKRNLIVLLFLLLCTEVSAQRCAEAAATELPWRLRSETRSSTWGTFMRPVISEMQRLFPKPPAGLELTYGIYDAMGGPSRFTSGIQYYEGFFMIKDIVCENMNGVKKILPEGETGNWLYFRANDFRNLLNNFANSTSITLSTNEFPLYSANIQLVENENGMMSVYVYNARDEQKFAGWYFAAKKQLPIRKITRKELAQSYRAFWVKKLEEDIKRLEALLVSSKKAYARVSADPGGMSKQDQEKSLKSILDGDATINEIITRERNQIADCKQRMERMIQSPDAGEPVKVNNINDLSYDPETMMNTGDKGQFVYVEDEEWFNKKLPKAQPQFIVSYFRRPEVSPAKTAFSNKVELNFDWNIIRKMVGMAALSKPLTITEMGNSPAEYTTGSVPMGTGKPTTANGIYFTENFEKAPEGMAPPKWVVSNNTAIIKKETNNKWLAMKKEGLFFPDYAVLQLPSSFTLEFDLRWNAAISYYSPEFLVHIGAARYDNTLKRYDREQVNVNSYTSGYMERICLAIDPHWNDASRYGMQVFDKRGGYLYDKSNTTNIFYKDRNEVHVKLKREGTKLRVYFNEEQVTELPDALKEDIRWNFIGFGLRRGTNALPDDEFYIGNISLTK
jgi:hypothetical protein